LRALLERLRSPAGKAARDAGPPNLWVFAGFGLSLALFAFGWWAGVLRDVPWPFWALIPIVVQTVIGVADRDGWNIRRAMAYVATEQRGRWTRGRFPGTPGLARAWLDDPSNAEAAPLEVVTALLVVGDLEASRTILETYAPATDVQAAAVIRTLAYLRALETGTIDMGPIRVATERLTEEDRRYQLTAAAWAQAWLDIGAGRPWRQRFANAVRDLGPHPVPTRVLGFIAAQQLSASIATVLATAIMVVVAGSA